MGRFFFVFALFFFPKIAVPQAVANAVLDPDRVETGDTFSLRILVAGTNAEPGKVDFSAWSSFLPTENILRQSGWTRLSGRWVRRFTLIAFDSATFELPPLTVSLHLGETTQTNSLKLTAIPTFSTADVEDMETIRDIERTSVSWLDYWPWGLGILTFLMLIFKFLRRKKPRPQVVMPVLSSLAETPAHLVALQKITLLEQQQLCQKGEIKTYYAELSLILREYLERRYDIAALESTTREIKVFLKKTNFPEHLRPQLDYLLQQADFAKYAQKQPPPNYHATALETARILVKSTA